MSGILDAGERDRQAAAIRSRIDTAANVLHAGQAAALRAAIEYTGHSFHREVDGFSSVRDWLTETFNFHARVAANIAAITRLAPKFKALAASALAAQARIDAVAYAMYRLDTTGLRIVARLPYPDGPQPSPYDATVECATPEETIRECCVHASQAELRAEIDRFAALLEQSALDAGLSQQTLAWVELTERGDGLWELNGLLDDDTGRLLSNYFKTAVPPPRQDEVDAEGVLPVQANRDAEALHQMVAAAGAAPNAPKRHGHTATLNVVCDLETLQGKDTGRVPTMDGNPIPLAKARLFACEARVIPSIYNYRTGEVVELGKEVRLPNVFLRRKLELEQPDGCAWTGCTRPVSWCEAHHVIAWHDGGPTDADNLILLCRFHHGRIHTDRWTITKTGPGAASIRRRGCSEAASCRRCPACSDAGLVTKALSGRDLLDVFPTGLEPEEWTPSLRDMLNDYARWASERVPTKTTGGDMTGNDTTKNATEAHKDTEDLVLAPVTAPPPGIMGERYSESDPIPFLPCPQRVVAEGEGEYRRRAQ